MDLRKKIDHYLMLQTKIGSGSKLDANIELQNGITLHGTAPQLWDVCGGCDKCHELMTFVVYQPLSLLIFAVYSKAKKKLM